MRATLSITILLMAAAAGAQTPFALQGLGQPTDEGSARDFGRGGWGLADRDTLNPGLLNQAALADLRYVQLLFGGVGSRSFDEGGPTDDAAIDRNRETWMTTVPGLRFTVPLRAGRLAASVGLDVERTFRYEVFTTAEIERLGEEISVNREYARSGNLLEIPLGLAWRPLDALALGASVNLVRGPVEDRVTQTFGGLLDNRYVERRDLSGTSVTGSALWDAPGPFSLGVSVTSGYDLDIDHTIEMGAVAGEYRASETIAMPAEYGAGLMIDLGRHWRFGADGWYTPFGDIGPNTSWGPHVRDEWKLAAGFERRLRRAERGRDYGVPLRFGFSWRRWGHEVGGAPVDERAVSVGSGVPFRNWLGTIDLSLSYAWIGDEADNGWRSQVVRLGVSISGLERLVF